MDRSLHNTQTGQGALGRFVAPDITDSIIKLKQQMNAVILAHYYQDDDIQDVADFIGDSLELSKKAKQTDAEYIVFCGVRFMADVAKIFNPEKKVLLPDLAAGCSLEESCKADDFKKFKEQYPDHIVLTYINSSIEVKALSDIIVTSSSAERIINQLPKDQKIIFGPDKYLGKYLIKKTGRDMVLWHGSCIVHEQFSEKALIDLKLRHDKALIIAHPECPEALLNYANFIGSTSALIKYTENNDGKEFIVLTEPGIIHQMLKHAPNSIFYDVPGISDGACASCNTCPYMRLNNIEKLYACMVNKTPEIVMEDDLREAALKPLLRMLQMA